MSTFKKICVIVPGTALMVMLILALGGIYILPDYMLKPLFENETFKISAEFFCYMLLPGFVVGYSICQSRILGGILFTGFIACSIMSGFNLWWIATAILLVLSFLLFIKDNVGDYDDLDTYDRVCVWVPILGMLRFIEYFDLENVFNVIGKIIAILTLIATPILPFFQAFADVNLQNNTIVGQALVGFTGFVNFGNTLFGLIIYNAFLPLISVLMLKYLFDKKGLSKAYAIIFGGYNFYRGVFIFIPLLMAGMNGTTEGMEQIENPVFSNLFGKEASLLIVLLICGWLCLKTAFGKKEKTIGQFCMSNTGAKAINILSMAALLCAILFAIAPFITYVLGMVILIVCTLTKLMAASEVPDTSYRGLRKKGYSHEDACRMCGLDPAKTSRTY